MLESLLVDQRSRWERGEGVPVSWYLERYPDLARDENAIVQLIHNEIAIRTARGESLLIFEYLKAYPQCADRLIPNQARTDPPSPHASSSASTPALLSDPQPSETISQASRNENFATALPVGDTEDTSLRNEVPQLFATVPAIDATIDVDRATHSPSADSHPNSNYETLAADSGITVKVLSSENNRYPSVPGFELLSELGRGGMGIVYRARQKSTRRIVALKIVRNDLLDTLAPSNRKATLERFHTEAQAAACLQHDNVVSVYEVGEVPSQTSGGSALHYYAMRFVKGKSLFDILRDGPLENRRAAAYIQPVAAALQAAHDQGILHRDLKPHNIMVEDRTDRPLVTDFGLAKFVEGQNSITYAGQVMGTPAYMSPEQATDAASVTAAADQYSIGATLYHILTGRPPFQAANIAETIRQIIDQQPIAPRQLNAAIHRDLETICLKAIQKEPSRRYANCAELADDLQRFLDGKPIVARPISAAERTWRWCRRNPVPSILGALAACLLFAFVVSLVVGYRTTSAALAVSESHLNKALQVVDEMFTRVSEDELLNEPGMQPLRAELLEKALKHYEYFLEESGSNEKLGDAVAMAHFRVGMIYQLTKRLQESETELLLARDQQESLLDREAKANGSEKRAFAGKSLADTCNALGTVYSRLGKSKDAIAMLERATQLRSALATQFPEDLEYQRLQSNSMMNLGLVRISAEQVEEGLQQMRQAQSIRTRLLTENPQSLRLLRDFALGWYSMGKQEAELGQLEPALTSLSNATDAFRNVVKQDPRSLSDRYRLLVALTLIGGVRDETDRRQEALNAYEEALPIGRALVAGNPEVPDYAAALLDLCLKLGITLEDLDDLDRSFDARQEALALAEQLHRREPEEVSWQSDMAYCHSTLGDVERRRGNVDEARNHYRNAIDHLKSLLANASDPTGLQEQIEQNEAELQSLQTP